MITIGKFNPLKIVRDHEAGVYLDGEEFGEILLPNKYVPQNPEPGQEIEVFIHKDSEDRLVAITDTPYAMRDEVAFLEVVEETPIGTFLDWGLDKDLLIPFSEQNMKMIKGNKYVVYVTLDHKSNRLIGTTRFNKYIHQEKPNYKIGDEVNIIILQETDLGYKAIVENKFWGMIYHNQIFQDIEIGDQLVAYIKLQREDHKIDLSLQSFGKDQIDTGKQIILDLIKENGGVLQLSDKSSPKEIKKLLKMSKKNFKKAVGSLFKDQIITIEENQIRLK